MCFTCVVKPRCGPSTDTVFNCSPEMNWLSCPKWDIAEREPVMDTPLKDGIDLSNVTFINKLWLVAPTSEIILKISIFLPVVVWGLFGNILLLYVIVKNRHLRTPTNLLISNMATADLVTLLFHPCVFLVYDFFQNYQLGSFGCKIEGGMECTLLISNVVSLVAISYDRLNAIVLPQEKRLTRFGAKILMGVAWMVGVGVAIPLYIYRTYRERQWLDFLEKYCTENATITNIYWHVIITMMVWFPLGFMLVCYVALFMKLRQYEKVVLRRANSMNVSYKKKVAKMMFIVISVFVICRLPFTALIFYRNELLKRHHISTTPQVQNQVNGAYRTLWFISRYLIVTNSALNPVIYGLTGEKFRKTFKATSAGKWLFIFGSTHAVGEFKEKKKPKQNDMVASTTNKIKIFFIFRGKMQKNNETAITDSVSDAQVTKPI